MQVLGSKIIADGDKWSGEVETKWTPPGGLFAEGSANKIANEIIKNHDDLKSAVASLEFYRNRNKVNSGSPEMKAKLDKVHNLLRRHYE